MWIGMTNDWIEVEERKSIISLPRVDNISLSISITIDYLGKLVEVHVLERLGRVDL
jgi:hypothetical protein